MLKHSDTERNCLFGAFTSINPFSNTVKPVLETTCIKQSPTLRDLCSYTLLKLT